MPLSQPHADTMELDDAGPDTDRHVCVRVCVDGLSEGACVRAP